MKTCVFCFRADSAPGVSGLPEMKMKKYRKKIELCLTNRRNGVK